MDTRRWGKRLALVVVLFGGLAAGADTGRAKFDRWIDTTELPPLTITTGTEVLARDGTLLRAFQVADGRWRLAPGAVDPRLLEMLVAWEDQRFYRHDGVDRIAALRAGLQVVRHGRVVSGASTLTMQVARLLEEGPTGEWQGKLRQMRVAWALERRLTKAQIVDLYLRLAPYGSNVEGIRAASLQWFGREPRRLTAAQAALLVALPQSPETRRPDRYAQAGRTARDRVLDRAAHLGILSKDEAALAKSEPVPTARRAFPALAPLMAARLARQSAPGARIDTTIDPVLQRRAEALARTAIHGRPGRVSAAMIVADHRTGEVLAEVGAAEWTDTPSGGFVDMTRAVRSPGSTLKPFVYGLAFDQGLAHPESLIEDRPTSFGRWQPNNFDNEFRGTISLRRALILSLNIPVVQLADALGPARIVQVLQRGGVRLTVGGNAAPGLAIVLGGAGTTLNDLANGYAAIAQGGQGRTLSPLPGGSEPRAQRMFGAVAAWQVANILSQIPPPGGAQAGRVAFKTGTSYGYRDALAVGFDGAHLVAVWMGRPDGTPVPGSFGGDVAAPVMFDMFDALRPVALPPPPPSTLTVANNALPIPLRRFAPAGEATAVVTRKSTPGALRVTFPPEGAELDRVATLTVKAQGGRGPYTFLLNGAPVVIGSLASWVEMPGPGPGFSKVTVIDADGASVTANVRVN
ncbi:MAG: penicillin-binding protein 1C [Paracoccus denitrificans]|nr:MAG: penicillin-binding protein 1C [Paracoccus denitrificans]PZO83905.1 MAG: penicillin-binding protein 1C [Paracoccus denitrificans]